MDARVGDLRYRCWEQHAVKHAAFGLEARGLAIVGDAVELADLAEAAQQRVEQEAEQEEMEVLAVANERVDAAAEVTLVATATAAKVAAAPLAREERGSENGVASVSADEMSSMSIGIDATMVVREASIVRKAAAEGAGGLAAPASYFQPNISVPPQQISAQCHPQFHPIPTCLTRSITSQPNLDSTQSLAVSSFYSAVPAPPMHTRRVVSRLAEPGSVDPTSPSHRC